METRDIADPLERKACNDAYDTLAEIFEVPGVAQVFKNLAAGSITKEQADEQIKELLAGRRTDEVRSSNTP